MWTLAKALLSKANRLGRNQQGLPPKAIITVAGQKWLGPGESMRILEVEIDGATHRLAVWNGAKSSQILELTAGVSKCHRAREAAC